MRSISAFLFCNLYQYNIILYYFLEAFVASPNMAVGVGLMRQIFERICHVVPLSLGSTSGSVSCVCKLRKLLVRQDTLIVKRQRKEGKWIKTNMS